MTYCVSDIHGEYDAYLALLDKIHFSQDDTLYILGDLVDRGPKPLTVLRDVMLRPNVVALAGNHDFLARMLLPHMIHGGLKDELDDKGIEDALIWAKDGGLTTLKEFQKLSLSARRDVVDWLGELELYQEVTVNGRDFVLVHTGLGPNAGPARPLEDYSLEECLFYRSNYDTVCFPGKYVVSGHTPTRCIPGNPLPDRIYRTNRHIAIDCGCTFGGYLAALCLETDQEFYV